MEARAELKFARISARKAKIVLDLIKGKDAHEALAILKYTNKAASPIVSKILKSAMANATNNHSMNENKLVVAEAVANQGPTMKRISPRAQGRAYRIRKRTSHIRIVLKEVEQEEVFMGQKVSPHGLRVGIIKDWSSKWYANKQNFADYLVEDNKIRKYLKETLKTAGISSINIERKGTEVRVNVMAAKPGMIIGKAGAAIEELKKKLEKMTCKTVSLKIVEVKKISPNAG